MSTNTNTCQYCYYYNSLGYPCPMHAPGSSNQANASNASGAQPQSYVQPGYYSLQPIQEEPFGPHAVDNRYTRETMADYLNNWQNYDFNRKPKSSKSATNTADKDYKKKKESARK